MNKPKKNYGMTLVSLIVTVVIMLILAGIAISLVVGNNGVLTQASSAVEKTREGTAREEVALAWESIESEYISKHTQDSSISKAEYFTEDNLNKYLEDKGKVSDFTYSETSNTAFVYTRYEDNTSYQFIIDTSNVVTIAGVVDTNIETWSYDTNGNVTNGTVTLAIGDYVGYTSDTVSYTSTSAENGYGNCVFGDYTGKWQVLGVDSTTKELLLISSSNVGTLYLKGRTGYANCEKELDKIGNLYATGTGADKGRSVKVEDVNKITGYNPNNEGQFDLDQTGEGTKYSKNYLYEYGNEVTYYWQGKKYPYYEATNGKYGSLSSSHSSYFYWWTGSSWESSANSETASESSKEKITELKSDFYDYYPETLSTNYDKTATVGLASGSSKYSLLFNQSYWLSSCSINTNYTLVYYGCRVVYEGEVTSLDVTYSDGAEIASDNGVRAVVLLKSTEGLSLNSTVE